MSEDLMLFDDMGEHFDADDSDQNTDDLVDVDGPWFEASIVWKENGQERRSTFSMPMSWTRDQGQFTSTVLHDAEKLWESYCRYMDNANAYRSANGMPLIDYKETRDE